MTREQIENSFVADIEKIMSLPIQKVDVYRWTDKFVFRVVKITVYAGGRYFVLDEIPGNTSSLDVVVDGKPFWVTGQKNFNKLVNIRGQLLEQYNKKIKG